MTLTIELLPLESADDTVVESWLDVWDAWASHDRPNAMPFCRDYQAASLRHPLQSERTHRLVASVDGEVAGFAEVELPLADNTSTALVEVAVQPGFRRIGIGRRLFDAAVAIAVREGRSTVIAESGEPLDTAGPGRRFMESYGAQRAHEDLMSELDPVDLPPAKLADLHRVAAEHAVGYGLERFVGPIDDDSVYAGIAVLESTLSTDAPLGDLEWERENWDAARVRDSFDVAARRGMRMYTTLARHLESGRIVAESVLVRLPSLPAWAMQWATVVVPAHRGHRLGLLVKTANLGHLLAHEPAVRRINTFNAASNRHMLAVNQTMGFRPVERWWEWQLKPN